MEGLAKLLVDVSQNTSPGEMILVGLLLLAIAHPFLKSYYKGQGRKEAEADPDTAKRLIDRGREMEKMDELIRGQKEVWAMLNKMDEMMERSLITQAQHDGRIKNAETRLDRLEMTVGVTPQNHK